MNKICPICGESGRVVSAGRCTRCSTYFRRTGKERPLDARRGMNRGPDHPAWKGDDASTSTKRDRARRRFALGLCEECGAPAMDRHHKDGDTGNNVPSNIAILCRSCHMKADGRLDALRSMAIENAARLVKPERPCIICNRMTKLVRKGRCPACNQYLRNHGIEWTADVESRKPRKT
jgi:5-methylcytosine-specific restriction endonuclease McrA